MAQFQGIVFVAAGSRVQILLSAIWLLPPEVELNWIFDHGYARILLPLLLSAVHPNSQILYYLLLLFLLLLLTPFIDNLRTLFAHVVSFASEYLH